MQHNELDISNNPKSYQTTNCPTLTSTQPRKALSPTLSRCLNANESLLEKIEPEKNIFVVDVMKTACCSINNQNCIVAGSQKTMANSQTVMETNDMNINMSGDALEYSLPLTPPEEDSFEDDASKNKGAAIKQRAATGTKPNLRNKPSKMPSSTTVSPSDDKVKCNLCPKTFSRKDNLKTHQKSAHSETRKYHICIACSYTHCPTPQDLQTHYLENHQLSVKNGDTLLNVIACVEKNGIKIAHHICSKCPKKRFAKPQDLQRHYSSAHKKSVKNRDSLLNVIEHVGPGDISKHYKGNRKHQGLLCNMCGAKIHNLTNLKRHMRTRHPIQKDAQICDLTMSDDDGVSLAVQIDIQGRQVSFFKENLSCLEPEKYLNENVIDIYLQLKLADKQVGKNVLLMESRFLQIIGSRIAQSGPIERLVKKYDILKADFLVFPICAQKHWFMFIVSRECDLHKVFVFNSMKHSIDLYTNHLKSLECFIRSSYASE